MASICCSPPERKRPLRSSTSRSLGKRSSMLSIGQREPGRRAMSRFSRAVR